MRCLAVLWTYEVVVHFSSPVVMPPEPFGVSVSVWAVRVTPYVGSNVSWVRCVRVRPPLMVSTVSVRDVAVRYAFRAGRPVRAREAVSLPYGHDSVRDTRVPPAFV